MDAAGLIRTARLRAGLTLRELAVAADTSHSAISAYESGAKVPNVATLNRIVAGAGFGLEVDLVDRRTDRRDSSVHRGRELEQVLELAEQFPASHHSDPEYPVFGR